MATTTTTSSLFRRNLFLLLTRPMLIAGFGPEYQIHVIHGLPVERSPTLLVYCKSKDHDIYSSETTGYLIGKTDRNPTSPSGRASSTAVAAQFFQLRRGDTWRLQE
ncbi:hypothetical protein TIFTF001_032861 [Ficus carica]|uniref:Uncharacterized protein n=1 Tax=Ficus carica TaxID=3494 RepID=A0AA88J784_FICCA|nr:hypothetical protein TIFTF001_032861 [Ficus carica]